MDLMERRGIYLVTKAVIDMCKTDKDLKGVIAALKKEINNRKYLRSLATRAKNLQKGSGDGKSV